MLLVWIMAMTDDKPTGTHDCSVSPECRGPKPTGMHKDCPDEDGACFMGREADCPAFDRPTGWLKRGLEENERTRKTVPDWLKDKPARCSHLSYYSGDEICGICDTDDKPTGTHERCPRCGRGHDVGNPCHPEPTRTPYIGNRPHYHNEAGDVIWKAPGECTCEFGGKKQPTGLYPCMDDYCRKEHILAHEQLERCCDCGNGVGLVWTAPDELWSRLVSDQKSRCVKCFDRKAERQGIFIRWRPHEESKESG